MNEKLIVKKSKYNFEEACDWHVLYVSMKIAEIKFDIIYVRNVRAYKKLHLLLIEWIL